MCDLQPLSFTSLRINGSPTIYRCDPEWNWAPPPLVDHDLWFVMSGRGQLNRDGVTWNVSPGSCVLLSPGDTPRGSQDPQDRLTVFFAHFDLLDPNGDLAPPAVISGQLEVRDRLWFVSSAHRIVQLWRRRDPTGRYQAELLLGVLIWQMWDEIQFPVSPANDVFDTLVTEIRNEPGRLWTLDGMANAASLSRAQFARQFRRLYGTSPMDFVIQARLDRAHYLLSESDLTTGQIAAALGYSDIYFFARQFKKFTGRTPGSLRKKR